MTGKKYAEEILNKCYEIAKGNLKSERDFIVYLRNSGQSVLLIRLIRKIIKRRRVVENFNLQWRKICGRKEK